MSCRTQVIALFLAALSTSGCADTKEVEINHHRAVCFAVAETLCKQTRAPGADHWQHMYEGIGGFLPQWGHRYRITMTTTEVSDPPADGSSIQYDLVEVLEDEKVAVGTTFELTVPQSTSPNALIERSGELDGTLIFKDFICDTESVCADLDAAITTGDDFVVTFAYGDPVEEVLIAVGVTDVDGNPLPT